MNSFFFFGKAENKRKTKLSQREKLEDEFEKGKEAVGYAKREKNKKIEKKNDSL